MIKQVQSYFCFDTLRGEVEHDFRGDTEDLEGPLYVNLCKTQTIR